MDEWFPLFAAAVWRYLDAAARRADSDPSAAAVDVRTLAAAWRTLLRVHRGVEHGGSCARCVRRRRRGGGRTEVCSVWQVAIGYFVRRPPGDR
ncbi:hypothetical protein H0B56_04585 [Haloechinothrix sp. YIM 98757]|uniref:Uncharacterized protein n=1 Tax=Haloechinothrix aidingensis TaxID=2752311 RepID=A0A838A8R0_9PSEU|nr:hypothetical protein [Haloechinothrix aidingensis]MBA0124812.1 hypothetical protein [Haloechinothrix aidingensis]